MYLSGPVPGGLLSEQVPHQEGIRGGGDEEGGNIHQEGGNIYQEGGNLYQE